MVSFSLSFSWDHILHEKNDIGRSKAENLLKIATKSVAKTYKATFFLVR